MTLTDAVVDGAGDGAAVGHALALQTQPQMEFLAKRPGPGLPYGKALLLRQFPDFFLNPIQPGDALHGLGGDRTLVFFNQLVKFSPRVRHAAESMRASNLRTLS